MRDGRKRFTVVLHTHCRPFQQCRTRASFVHTRQRCSEKNKHTKNHLEPRRTKQSFHARLLSTTVALVVSRPKSGGVVGETEQPRHPSHDPRRERWPLLDSRLERYSVNEEEFLDEHFTYIRVWEGGGFAVRGCSPRLVACDVAVVPVRRPPGVREGESVRGVVRIQQVDLALFVSVLQQLHPQLVVDGEGATSHRDLRSGSCPRKERQRHTR